MKLRSIGYWLLDAYIGCVVVVVIIAGWKVLGYAAHALDGLRLVLTP